MSDFTKPPLKWTDLENVDVGEALAFTGTCVQDSQYVISREHNAIMALVYELLTPEQSSSDGFRSLGYFDTAALAKAEAERLHQSAFETFQEVVQVHPTTNYPCAWCGTPIGSAQLCADCATRNTPFDLTSNGVTSKYADGSVRP